MNETSPKKSNVKDADALSDGWVTEPKGRPEPQPPRETPSAVGDRRSEDWKGNLQEGWNKPKP